MKASSVPRPGAPTFRALMMLGVASCWLATVGGCDGDGGKGGDDDDGSCEGETCPCESDCSPIPGSGAGATGSGASGSGAGGSGRGAANSSAGVGGGATGTGAASGEWSCSTEPNYCWCDTKFSYPDAVCADTWPCCIYWPDDTGFDSCQCSSEGESACQELIDSLQGAERISACPP